jgi:bifunctional DNase/RNase
MPCDCGCASHVRLLLYDPDGKQYFQVRIDAAVGQAVLAELNGLSSAHAEGVDLLKAAFDALGARPERLVLRIDGQKLSVRLYMRSGRGSCEAAPEPCYALLAACRMKIPIHIQALPDATRPEEIPEVYHDLLETLPLDGLGPPAGR